MQVMMMMVTRRTGLDSGTAKTPSVALGGVYTHSDS